jgi:two-component sensor histidine kinase
MDQLELRLAARTAVGDLQSAVGQKDAALERSRMLAKEIDHRVMNSLQQVSALLNLQSRTLSDEEAARQLQVAAARVTAVARVHQHIFQGLDADGYGCLGYLRRLCADLERMMSVNSILIEGTDVELPDEKIAPIGLLVNELVTNASKNGASQIRVTLEPEGSEGGRYRLSVSDDGQGLPADFSQEETSGLGMKVVRMVVRQLGGTLGFGRCEDLGGAEVTIRFPLGEAVLNLDPVTAS